MNTAYDGADEPCDGTDEPYGDTGVPHNGSDTSEVAADSMRGHVSRLAQDVFQYIRDAEGATCDEVVQGLGMRPQTASPRIRELVLGNRIYDTGQRRKTSSGRPARVYKAVA